MQKVITFQFVKTKNITNTDKEDDCNPPNW